MNHHLPSNGLAVELLSMVFDSLQLRDLLTSSRVSRYWRDVAFHHPIFWRDIHLRATSEAALNLFRARLDASSVPAIFVHVLLRDAACGTVLRSDVLPAITRHLPRICRLSLEVDIAHDTLLFDALRSPAPELVEFNVGMVRITGPTSTALPIDLFAGHAPKLRNLRLLNVHLSADIVPRAFYKAKVLRFIFDIETESFPISFLSHCPDLQQLSIAGRRVTAAPGDVNQPGAPHVMGSLKYLEFATTDCLPFLRNIQHAVVPKISVAIRDHACARVILDGMRQDLELGLVCRGTILSLLYTYMATNVRRVFTSRSRCVADGRIPSVYVADDVLRRVRHLVLSSNCSNFLPALRELPACTLIVVGLLDEHALQPPPYPISVPELNFVRFSSQRATRINSSEILAFLDGAFVRQPRPVRIELQEITLADRAELPARFKVMHIKHK